MTNNKIILLFACTTFYLLSCTSSRKISVINKKISAVELREDYAMFRGVLEELHPSLYWFSTKDSMDEYFKRGYEQITDSMTEQQFRNLLNYTTSKIRCGHTGVYPSKKFSRFYSQSRITTFPFAVKCWPDTAVVYSSLIPKDSRIKQGTQLLSIDGRSIPQLLDTFLLHINGDGYAATGRYQFLSNRGTFGAMYRNIFGLKDSLSLGYIDSTGIARQEMFPMFKPRADTTRVRDSLTRERKQRIARLPVKELQLDTGLRTGYISLNSFERNHGLTRFFRQSFKKLAQNNIQHLVIDLRSNGGGDAGLSTLLTRYVTDHRFRVADSLYAKKRSSRYRDHIQWQPIYWLFTLFVTRKREDGNFHFGVFERHYFGPRKKHHFEGQVYLLTGGNSFSATTIFVQELKGQKNVKIIGEETGGGAYGNTAWMIPMVTLPHSKLRVRIPKFRMVMEPSLAKEGRGVMPDIPVAPTFMDIRNGIDVKMEKARQLILLHELIN